MATATFNDLAGANTTGTVLDNLQTAPATVKTALSGVLNSALHSQLSASLMTKGVPVLADLVEHMPSADLAAASSLSVQDFLKQQLDPMVKKDHTMQQAVDKEIATLSGTDTIGTLLNLNQPLASHPLFQGLVNQLQLSTLLATSPSLGSGKIQTDFIAAYTASRGPIKNFWAQLPSQSSEFTAAIVSELQLTLHLGTLTLNNVPLIQAIQNLRQQGAVTTLQDLVSLNAAAWTNLINTPVDGQIVTIPASVPGATAQAKTTTYVNAIMTALQTMFPTAALGQQIAQAPAINPALVRAVLNNNPGLDLTKPTHANLNLTGLSTDNQAKARTALAALRREINMFPGLDYKAAIGIGKSSTTPLPTSFQNPIRTDVVTFLGNSPDFNFRTTNIDAYITANPTALNGIAQGDQTVLRTQLKTFQRIFRVTLDLNMVNTLMGEGFASAYSISSLPKGVFTRQYSGLLGGINQATAIYNTAQFVDAQAVNVYMRVQDVLSGFNPAFIGSFGVQAQNVLQQNIANWQTLFGSTSYCACPECAAVDGPAAYFVDLLQFLGGSTPNVPGNNTPLDVLIGNGNGIVGRRPDLAYLKLDCANTDTTLPYVDLVNEILESYAYYAGTLQGASNNTPSDATADQLRVNPEYTLDAAYLPLSNAIYPFNLPYDRFLTTARVYLESLGSSRYELMQKFGLWGVTVSVKAANVGSATLTLSNAQAGFPSNGTIAQINGELVSPISFHLASDELTLNLTSPLPMTLLDGMLIVANDSKYTLSKIADPQAALAAEYLHISPNEYYWITGRDLGTLILTSFVPASDPWTLFGYSGPGTPPWDQLMSKVSYFLERTDLAFADLVSLLQTQYFNPGQAITLQASDSCDVSATTITPPPGSTLDASFLNLPSFLRLWKKLGWQMSELDKAISAINSIVEGNPTLISRTFIVAAAQLKQLQGILKLTVAQLLSLWANIDDDGRDSLYIQLFQNKAVVKPLDSFFALTYRASLASLPPNPNGARPAYVHYNSQILEFSGTMSDQQQSDLLTWANGDGPTILAIQNLFNQRWAAGTDIVVPAGRRQPLICDHINTILAALQVNAADLSAIAADCELIPPIPPGADLNGYAWAVIGGTVTVGTPVALEMVYKSHGVVKHLPGASYTVLKGDTLELIAAQLAAQINANTVLLADGIWAAAQTAIVNIYIPGPLDASITLSSTTPGSVTISTCPPLNIANLSKLYRYALLAQALNLSVSDLISLKTLTGINPFVAATADPVTDNTFQFVQAAQTVASSKFSIAQLNYLYRAIADTADSLPPLQATQDQLAMSLSAGLQKIATANAYTPDPSGAVLRKKLAVLLPADQVAATMNLINGSAVYTSNTSTNPLTTLPAALTRQANQPCLTTLVTIGGTATQGDKVTLNLTLPGVAGSPFPISYPVESNNDTPTKIALALCLAFPNLVAANPALAGISASSSGPVVNISTPLALGPIGAWAATTTPTVATTPNATETVTVSDAAIGEVFYLTSVTIGVTSGNSVTVGDTVTLTAVLYEVPGPQPSLAYTVEAGDTPSSIATNLNAQINNNQTLSAAGVSSTVAGAVITISAQLMLDPSITCAANVAPPTAATEQVSVVNGAPATITLGGNVTPGDTATLSISSSALAGPPMSFSYPIGDTPSWIAASLATEINANTVLQGQKISAIAAGPVINISVPTTLSSSLTWTPSVTNGSGGTPTEKLAIVFGSVGSQTTLVTVTVGGSAVTPTDEVTLTVATSSGAFSPQQVSHIVAGPDTLTTIAAGFVAQINRNPTLTAAHISAAAATPVGTSPVDITISSSSSPQPSITCTANVTPPTTATELMAIAGPAPATVNVYVPTTVTLSGNVTPGDTATLSIASAIFAGPPVSFSYPIGQSDKLTSIAQGLATRVSSNPTLNAAGISANATGSVLTLSNPPSLSPLSSPQPWSYSVTPPATAPVGQAVTETVAIAGTALQCVGPMSDATETNLSLLNAGSASGSQFTCAVADLYNQAQDILSQNLSFLAPAKAYVTSLSNVVASNTPTLLANTNPLPSVPPGVVTFTPGNNPTLTCFGPMTNATRIKLLALVPNDTGANFASDVNALYGQAWDIPGQELIDAPSSVADRYDYVLENLLAYLQTTQSQSLVKQTLSQALSLDPTSVALLVEGDPTTATAALLPSKAMATQQTSPATLQTPPAPAMVDFLGGLAAYYYTGTDLSDAPPSPPTQIDPGVDLVGSQAPFGSAQWFGQIVPPTSDIYTFFVPTVPANAGQAQLWVNGQLLVDQVGNQAKTPQIPLQAGQIYDLQLNYVSAPPQAQIQLQWSNSSMAQVTIPPAAFVLGAAPASAQGMSTSSASTFVQGGIYSTLSLLNRVALLVNGFSMKTDEVAYLSANPESFAGVDPGDGKNRAPFSLNSLPLDNSPIQQGQIDTNAIALFNQWTRLNALYKFKASVPGGNTTVFDIFRAASASGGVTPPVSAAVAQTVEQATAWNATEFQTLAGAGGFGLVDANFTDERALVQLASCLSLGTRLGISSKQLFQWANNAPDSQQALDIATTVKSKYDDTTWLQVGPPLNDKIRAASKKALIAYILTMQQIPSNVTDADGLYEYFLIDVQMSTCMLTSRLVQATAAVQLFIQRCLMNLENGYSGTPALDVLPSQIDATEWEGWRKNYRVWQANREVFLYPENWIDPTLRDDRTPYFQELQNQLLQGPVTADNVEQAYRSYLQQLQEVSQLEMVGLCIDDHDSDPSNPYNTVHVFGRTGSPYTYYYRALTQTWDNVRLNWMNVWSAWEKVDLDIQSDQLIPAVWNNRLYLFWPLFTESADSSNPQNQPTTQSSTPALKMLQVQMAWSEYKQGAWTKKQVTTDMWTPSKLASYQELSSIQFQSQYPWDFPVGSCIVSSSSPPQVQSGFTSSLFFGTDISLGFLILSIGYCRDMSGGLTVTERFGFDPVFIGTYTFYDYGAVPEVASLNSDLFGADFSGPFPPWEPLGMYYAATGSLSLTMAPNGQMPVSEILTMPYQSNDVHDYYWLLPPPIQLQSSSPPYSQMNFYPPLFFLESNRTYFVTQNQTLGAPIFVPTRTGVNPTNDSPANIASPYPWVASENTAAAPQVQFHTHYHPHIRDFIQALNVGGLDGLLTLQNQSLSDMLATHAYATSKQPDSVLAQNTLGEELHDDGLICYVPSSGGGAGMQQLQQLDMVDGSQVYVFSAFAPGTTPLYQLQWVPNTSGTGTDPYFGSTGDQNGGYLYTISPQERLNALNWYGYQDAVPGGVIGYVYGPQSPYAGTPGTVPLYRFSSNRFAEKYDPANCVATPYPKEDVDFSPEGAYSIYNWELFFHIPFLIATQLSQNQQFEDAQTWFHYIFNPTNDSGGPVPNRYWNFWPFNEYTEVETLSDLLGNLDSPSSPQSDNLMNQVVQYQTNPFDPDAIARLRPLAYQKAVVMKYLDNLIAWGDSLFAQNTRESISEATQIYVLAQQILGPRPIETPAQGPVPDYTYNDLRSGLDGLDNVLINLENGLLFCSGVGGAGQGSSGASVSNNSVASTFYFCTPPNDTLLGYWDTVADRLYKIRHCMNIQGQVEQLALFAPPINPALLVAAQAAGVDLSSALSDINAALPYYRFSYVFGKALELCSEVRSLGGALLSALEKQDAESLALLRANQELTLQNAILQIKQLQISEANANLQGLTATQAVTTYRQSYYQGLINAGLSAFETGQVSALTSSQEYKTIAQGVQLFGTIIGMLPDFDLGVSGIGASPVVTATWGGRQLSDVCTATASMLNMFADAYAFQATMAGLGGQWDRRNQDWKFQLQTAALELQQIAQQINAANFRIQISQQDLSNQQIQINNASDVLNFLQTKHTNEDLYDWMVGQVSGVYFQCYQMAYDLAKRAESCFQFELGLPSSSYIQFGYWDSLKQGLLSGEKLYLDLKRLEQAYMDQNKREYEITRNISLVLLDPVALITLKETGQSIVNFPETFFDMDYPGQYMRRVKSLSLTIPCITGPYTSVNCTLTLLQSKIRFNPQANGGYPESQVGPDPRFLYNFAATQSIATSAAQNDSGMFEVNFRDERYLPFEGGGAISQWLISMPKECNAFDFETITDVIFNLRYTARDGGVPLSNAARGVLALPQLQTQSPISTSKVPVPPFPRFFSLKHEFPTEWYQFMNPSAGATVQTMPLPLTIERFPYQYRGKQITISEVDLLLRFKDVYPPFVPSTAGETPAADFGQSSLRVSLGPAGSTTPGAFAANGVLNGMPYAAVPISPVARLAVRPPPNAAASQPWTWTLTISEAEIYNLNLPAGLVTGVNTTNAPPTARLNPAVIEDIFMVCHYRVK